MRGNKILYFISTEASELLPGLLWYGIWTTGDYFKIKRVFNDGRQ